MVPRVQTFAWRLLRKALPTGCRASRFSRHITKACCRCSQDEDEMHLFFICPFVRAAWFAHPWYLRTDLLTENHHSMQNIIYALLNMNHPYASIPNIFNLLWCIWKSRNDCLFARKCTFPHQVHLAALAMAEWIFHYRTWLVYSNDGLPQNALGLREQASWMHTHLVSFVELSYIYSSSASVAWQSLLTHIDIY